jgi:hypothetical protein
MHQPILRIAAFLGALSVILGAFAAHSLKDRLTPDLLAVFMTGERYQFYHVFALLATGIIWKERPMRQLVWAARLFLVGIFLFSGSLYLLALTGTRWLGAITPLGGLCFIGGWLLLMFALLKRP